MDTPAAPPPPRISSSSPSLFAFAPTDAAVISTAGSVSSFAPLARVRGALGPAAVTLRYAIAGSTNAMRNEHVEPVSPNANATFGTYRDKHSAVSMDPNATMWEIRAASLGETSSSDERTTTPPPPRNFSRSASVAGAVRVFCPTLFVRRVPMTPAATIAR